MRRDVTSLECVTRLLAVFIPLVPLAACHRPSARPFGATAAAPPASASRPDDASVSPELPSTAAAQALSDAFAGAAEAIRASVVRIDVEGIAADTLREATPPPEVPDFLRKFFEDGAEEPPPSAIHGTGSGIIVDGAGHVLTNGHVVRGAHKVTIELADRGTFPARVVGTDPLTDVGVVRFERPPPGLVAARLGDSDKLRIGQWTIAAGSPLGMDQTVTVGIVSGIGATGGHFRFESGERVRRYIETDAKINPGNSGGPLVDLEGQVVGLNTLINVGPGGSYGFAIPINEAWQVARALIKDGRVRYPYIGIAVAARADPARVAGALGRIGGAPEGAFVGAVTPGSPADEAGLETGDVITRIAGHRIESPSDVVAAISAQRIGSSVIIDYTRARRSRMTTVKVTDYPAPRASPTD
jgi:serine protease Do